MTSIQMRKLLFIHPLVEECSLSVGKRCVNMKRYGYHCYRIEAHTPFSHSHLLLNNRNMANLTLDSNNFVHQDVSPWSTGLKWGAIGGIGSIILSMILYLSGLSNPENTSANWVQSLASFVLVLTVIILAVNEHKRDLQGYISYGRSVGVGAIVSLVMAIFAAIFTFIFFGFIAPDYVDIMMETAMAEVPEAQQEDTEAMMGFMFSPGMMSLFGFLGSMFWGVVISLIASIFLRKPRPAMY